MIATARAFAKLNLTLEVVGRRPDGFHDLQSLVAVVDWYDEVRASPADGAGVTLICDRVELANEGNLVYVAASRLASAYRPPAGVSIELKKRIPVAAGLGGGSSDAAATLALCNRFWQLGLTREELARIGAEIGSDVAFFFSAPRAIIRGRGELVEPVEAAWFGWAVLVLSGALVSTVQVYRAWRRDDRCALGGRTLQAALAATSAAELSACLFNDLESAVFRVSPVVKRCFDDLEAMDLAGRVRVTGAGSVLYVLEDNEDAARTRAAQICNQSIGVAVRVVRFLTTKTLVVREE